MSSIKNYKDLLKRVEKVTLKHDIDLSSGEDLSVGIMNLISIEEHLFFTAQKTKDSKYIDLLNEVRAMRTAYLKEIIKDYEGEVWCISKHLLAASMRLMEVGNKELKKAKGAERVEAEKGRKKAEKLFADSYKLYTLFWGLNLSQVKKVEKVEKIDKVENKVNFLDEKGEKATSVSVFSKLGAIITKALDCCRE
jgi:hypothetical protein